MTQVAVGRADLLAQAPSADKPAAQTAVQTEKRITPEQAKELFKSIDELLSYSSTETGLPIKHEVKRKLISRSEIEAELKKKFEEDKDAKRMERSEIVLKKFGFLDRDFNLKPFLLSLLTEQIAGFYDTKTRTVNLLDWLDADAQKPVMAHELTHALQDQYTDLEKFGEQTPEDLSKTYSDDLDHIKRDEQDTAREAVVEGQATAVFTDYILKPSGKTLIDTPEVVELFKQQMASNDSSSPIMARAPLLLSESMLFPYRDGLEFVQDIWMDKGRAAAFSGLLDHPPASSWEVINPVDFEKHHAASIPQLPNYHPLLDGTYTPYDIGQIGQLDVKILLELFGGKDAAEQLTPAWDGGIYWAGQKRNATAKEQATTASVAVFYLSQWKNADSAQRFAAIYADELGQKYSGLKHNEALSKGETDVYQTSEGPVTITTRGPMVFVTESIPLELAAKLTANMLDAQVTGEVRNASVERAVQGEARESLSGSLVRFFSNCGVMKFAVDAGVSLQKK